MADDRLDRIEHLTTGLAEQRRRDREEYRALWRETQRHLNELTVKMAANDDRMAGWVDELREADEKAREANEKARREFQEADRQLGERIAALTSGMGEFIARFDARLESLAAAQKETTAAQARTAAALAETAAAQTRTEKNLAELIAALARGRNGHQ